MKSKFKVKDITHEHKRNIYNIVVYDVKSNFNYHLYFKSSFRYDNELVDYIHSNPELFIYNIKRTKSRTGRNSTEYRESNIPDNLNKKELYEKIVKKNGSFLVYVPEDFKTKKMCFKAVKNDPMALRFVPDKFKDEELFELAISKNGICLQYVPGEYRSLELCLLALLTAPTALRYVPSEILTYEMCLSAVKMDMRAINYVPDDYLLDVYKDGVIGMNRLLPISKKDYHYRDYKKIIEKIAYLSSINISDAPKIESISDDEGLFKLQLSTAKSILLGQLSEIENKEQMLKNK